MPARASVLYVSPSEAVHDAVLRVFAASEKVDLIAYQDEQVLLQGARLGLEVACAFELLVFVDVLRVNLNAEVFDNGLIRIVNGLSCQVGKGARLYLLLLLLEWRKLARP